MRTREGPAGVVMTAFNCCNGRVCMGKEEVERGKSLFLYGK